MITAQKMSWKGIFLLVSAHICYCRHQKVVPDDMLTTSRQNFSERGNFSDKYLVVLPRVLIEGSTEVVCVTIYNITGPVDIKVLLSHGGDEAELVKHSVEVPHSCLDILVPEWHFKLSSVYPTISVHVRDGLLGDPHAYTLWAETDIQIEKTKVETFIETDKPIYMPGQTVKFRVLSLDQNLRADKAKVGKIWVETPSGIRIAQWLSVTGEQGLISLELPMTSDPMFGEWKILVKHRGVRSEQKFTVQEYVLPKFEVTIDGPSHLVINETSVKYRICGRYTYGQPVEGSVYARLSAEFIRPLYEREPLIFRKVQTGPSGCVEAAFDITTFSLLQTSYKAEKSKLKLDVAFTELATGVEAHENSECQLTFNAYIVRFVEKKYFKKGLPYTGRVHLTKPDGTPAENKVVRVQLLKRYSFRTWKVQEGGYSEDVVTDSHGFATFVVPNLRGHSRLAATIPGLSTEGRNQTQYLVSFRTTHMSVRPGFSPSDSYLQISLSSTIASVGSEMMVEVSYTGSRVLHSGELSTVFISNGNVIRHQTNISDSQFVTAGSLNYSVMELRFEVTPEMAPLTKLLVYYVTHAGEVVADSVHFEVNLQLANKVDISFKENEAKPGKETELLISAAPDSLCGVGIVDKSVNLLGGGRNNIQKEQLTEFLKKYQVNAKRGLTTKRCKQQARAASYPYFRRTPKWSSSSSFDDAGLLYMTNLDLENTNCHKNGDRGKSRFQEVSGWLSFPSRSPRKGPHSNVIVMDKPEEIPQPPRLRAYFPETWLWDLVAVDGAGHASVNLTVPDTITEWIGNGFCISETKGIGISTTSSLQAFQPFFLSYTLPYSVIRGETFPVKVTVFNYMNDCLVIVLTLSESENFTLASNEEQRKIMCVCGSRSSSVEFSIIPNIIGSMPVEVTAESISDDFGLCGNEIVTTLTNAGDAIRKEILVEAEGIEQEITTSEFFCPSESSDGFVWTQELETPVDIVPDTAWAKVVLTGDVMGPTLSNLEDLVMVPYGCGEQNMITFVPNVLAMQYLTATDQLTPDIAKQATDNMKRGYQREFNYRHRDGSFSAFGTSDPSGSSWLTAYVVRSFYQASQFIEVDFDNLQSSIDWLKRLQKSSGCFASVGRVNRKEMMGGLNNDLTLSAYVLVSLLEAGISSEEEVIVRGLQCLEGQLDSTNDNYALSQIAYAFALGNSTRWSDVLERLESVADYEGGKHWTSNRQASTASRYHRPSSADVEMTSYVLMAYLEVFDRSDIIAEGLPISRWLVQRRNSKGGFDSTQDTVVGLTALARFSEYTVSGDVDITLNVDSSQSQANWGTTQILNVTSRNHLVLQQLYIENIPTALNFHGSGPGCALLQVSLFYNKYPEEPEEPEFFLEMTLEDHPQVLDCSRFEAEVCARYSSDDEASNMAIIDFRLQSGYIADKASLDNLMETSTLLKRYEVDGKSVMFYFNEITSEATCVTFDLIQEIRVKETKPSFVTVYDYYNTDVRKTVTYSLICSIPVEDPLPAQPTLLVSPRPIVPATVTGLLTVEPKRDFVEVGSNYTMHCTINRMLISLTAQDLIWCRGYPPFSRMDMCPPKPLPANVQSITKNVTKSITLLNVQREDIGYYYCYLAGEINLPNTDSCRFNNIGCPFCEDELPSDWEDTFCHSHYAAVVRVKSKNRVELLENYRFGEENIDKTVRYTLDDNCSCELERGSSYIIFTDSESLDGDQREMTIDERALIVHFKMEYLQNLKQSICPIA